MGGDPVGTRKHTTLAEINRWRVRCFLLRVQHVCCCAGIGMPHLRSTYPQAMNKKPPTNAADIYLLRLRCANGES